MRISSARMRSGSRPLTSGRSKVKTNTNEGSIEINSIQTSLDLHAPAIQHAKKTTMINSSEKLPYSEVKDKLRTPQNNWRSDLLAESIKSKCGDDSTSLSRCCRDTMGCGTEACGEYLKIKTSSGRAVGDAKTSTHLRRGNTGEAVKY